VRHPREQCHRGRLHRERTCGILDFVNHLEGELSVAFEMHDSDAPARRSALSGCAIRPVPHFRDAEKENCIANHNVDSCILPLSPRAVHTQREGAEAARAVLERLLALPSHSLRLDAIWLLNITHMALGTWPDGVAEGSRIPVERFASEASIARLGLVGERAVTSPAPGWAAWPAHAAALAATHPRASTARTPTSCRATCRGDRCAAAFAGPGDPCALRGALSRGRVGA
jgi:hypothetical protein